MNISEHPHKNLIISGFVAFIIITVGVIINYFPLLFQEKAKNRVSTTQHTTSTITTRDSDADGVPDWEERLYGSDPFKTDTDGDGTPDGEELAMGRDPSRASTSKPNEEPNDKLKTIQDPMFMASSSAIQEQKKEFFSKYMAKSGDEIRETTYRDLIGKFDAEKLTPRGSLVDLNISSDNTDNAFRKFINDFGALILRYKTPNSPRPETEIMDEFAKTQDTSVLNDLTLSIIEYNNFAKDLRALSVPSGIAKTYLSIVQGYEGMALGLKGMQEMKTDPINASGGYEGYVMYRVQVADGFAVLVNEVTKRGLVFTKDESGYMFYANVFDGQN